ncbi:MAG: hypothetical protein II811_02045 [Spirochaetaceae bacterium]|nr:hypothetical protein [Spirochaetaceae bacterium]
MKKWGFLAFFSVLILFSCGEKKSIEDTALKVNAEGAIQLSVQNAQSDSEHSWNLSERKICVIFGYGYNSDEFVSHAVEELSSQYGLAEDGGLIVPLVFPNDFLHAGRARISLLKDLVSSFDLDGMIILGAPEATNKALAAIEDDFGGKKSYPVVAFFPQDDMLAMESVCDLVFEKTLDISSEEMLLILKKTVDYLPACAGSLELRTEIDHAKQMLGDIKTIKRYVDSDTGLTPENHFILE